MALPRLTQKTADQVVDGLGKLRMAITFIPGARTYGRWIDLACRLIKAGRSDLPAR